MHYSDNFQHPKPFKPDVVVGIDDVGGEEVECVAAMPSQFGDKDSWQGRTRPDVPPGDRERPAYLLEMVKRRTWRSPISIANGWSRSTARIAGKPSSTPKRSSCAQYGRQAPQDELKKIFVP